MKLLLVRHGQTDGNVRGALDTALPGPPLTVLGHEQAQDLVLRLDREPIVAVYASHAVRAQQTAAPLAAKLGFDVQVVDGVHEIAAGDFEGKTDKDSVAAYMSIVREWTLGALASSIPGGETGEQVRTRMLDAVARLRAKHERTDSDGTVVLVSHGGAIRLGGEWLAGNVSAEVANQSLIPNTGIIELEATEAGWICLNWAGVPVER